MQERLARSILLPKVVSAELRKKLGIRTGGGAWVWLHRAWLPGLPAALKWAQGCRLALLPLLAPCLPTGPCLSLALLQLSRCPSQKRTAR